MSDITQRLGWQSNKKARGTRRRAAASQSEKGRWPISPATRRVPGR